MSLDVTALRDSFAALAKQETTLARTFYDVLFVRYPQLKPLFTRGRTPQEKMLMQALAKVVEHAADPPWLTTTLQALGAKHAEYGVTDEMYEWFSECLLVAIGKILGDGFSPRVHEAWFDALASIASIMKAGAADVAQDLERPERANKSPTPTQYSFTNR